MNNRVDARINALAEAIERRKMEQEYPVDDLSRSLFELGRELAALDETGLAAEAEALDISPNDVRDMTQMYTGF